MVSGYYAYQLQTNETLDRLLVDRQKRKFSDSGVRDGPTTSTFRTVTKGIKADKFNMHNPYMKDFFDMGNICKNTVKSLYKEISVRHFFGPTDFIRPCVKMFHFNKYQLKKISV
jgi:hypothetical protein